MAYILIAVCFSASGFADPFVQFDQEKVFVCDVADLHELPPEPSSKLCEPRHEAEIALHQTTKWIIGEISPTPALMAQGEPIGLFIAAKASARIYLNGEELAANGGPAFDRELERAGRLDFVYYIPASDLQTGPNRIAILMSGHHSLNGSTQSLLTLGFFPFERAPYHERGAAIFATLMLGIFLVTAIYASVLAALGVNRLETLALTGTSIFASGQVIAETMRSFWAYPYYVHDLRLFAIIFCGLGVGLTLLGHTLYQINHGRPRTILIATLLVTLLGVFGVTGFDAKASMAILLPCLVAILVCLTGATPSDHRRLIYAAVFSVFTAANILDPGFFLDATYFAILAAAIWILSAFQAVAFVHAIKENERGDHARRRLEHLLARKSDLETPPLVVRHSGRMERFPMDDIIALEAAGDYVNLHVKSGRKVLATASLTALENELPDNFIRVHRSFLVNADKIVSLKRLPQGTGELVLIAGTTIPVSRRILPQLRKSLQSE